MESPTEYGVVRPLNPDTPRATRTNDEFDEFAKFSPPYSYFKAPLVIDDPVMPERKTVNEAANIAIS
jgi:hypothetical protein